MQGPVIAERYQLTEALGSGKMGSVHKAVDLASGGPVAVKIIHAAYANHPEARARFLREARIASTLESPYLVKVLDFGELPDRTVFMAMELLEGEDLKQRLKRMGRFGLEETARWVEYVCRGITNAHTIGLVHRDLKPANIVITTHGGEPVAKILDFGVAKVPDLLSDSSLDPTKTGTLLGTPYYMSPEQAQGLKNIDPRSDLWAIGVITFECLTGKRPFTAPALGPLVAKILAAPLPRLASAAPDQSWPPALEAWIARALARNPAERFGSARELADALHGVVPPSS